MKMRLLGLSFDPCSCGSGDSTDTVASDLAPVVLFRSLFLWIGRFNLWRPQRKIDVDPVSILVLVDRAIQPDEDNPEHVMPSQVSILVLVDRAIQPLERYKEAGDSLAFRSLFLWIGRFNSAIQ